MRRAAIQVRANELQVGDTILHENGCVLASVLEAGPSFVRWAEGKWRIRYWNGGSPSGMIQMLDPDEIVWVERDAIPWEQFFPLAEAA